MTACTMYHIRDEGQQLAFGAALAKATHQSGAVVFLEGPLGAGKTTVARGFLRALGYGGHVKSPTFSLVELYECGDRQLLHVDLYRLHYASEIFELGLIDQIHAKTLCLIEWAEKAIEALPKADLTCYISHFAAERQIKLVAHSLRGTDILKAMDTLWTN